MQAVQEQKWGEADKLVRRPLLQCRDECEGGGGRARDPEKPKGSGRIQPGSSGEHGGQSPCQLEQLQSVPSGPGSAKGPG